MSLFRFRKRKQITPPAGAPIDQGILVFANTSEVIRAESLLRTAGVPVKVMGPPPEIQSGCDLVIQFPLMKKLEILRILAENQLSPLQAVPVTGPLLKPVDIFQVKDFGRYLMVRAANMKLTVDKETRVIVNVSGGGCPDVPYLAYRLVGQTLEQAPRPRDIGHTVCGYALELAFQEMERQCSPS
jgi:hypothetical protein